MPAAGSRDEIEATARRRFGMTPIVGTAPELVDYFGSLQERGVERVYAWFCDFAAPDTLAAFGETVIRAVQPHDGHRRRASFPSAFAVGGTRPDRSLGSGLQCATQIESVDTQCCPGPR